jgi:hypothetical protein
VSGDDVVVAWSRASSRSAGGTQARTAVLDARTGRVVADLADAEYQRGTLIAIG